MSGRAGTGERPGTGRRAGPGPVEPSVIAVFGPTASGKSGIAEAIADSVGGEIVSCDAMQCYAGLPILTNQPERPTQLVGIWPLSHSGSVGEYQELAHAAIDAIVREGRTAVVCGGTGLYLRAALADLDLPPAPPDGLREEMEELFRRLGSGEAYAELARRDPAAAAAVHPNDRRRVVRALELHALGESLTPDRDRLWAREYRQPSLVVGLEVGRAELARRIDARAAEMWERGAEAEARSVLAAELSEQVRQVIGLREVEEGLARDAWIASVALRTRQYARRQRIWLRKVPGLVTVEAERPPAATADAILQMARAR